MHERTGEAIEALFKDRIDDHLAELAHHYSRTANTRKAVEYLSRAGSQAAARSAHSEAVTRLSSALELLKHLPDDAERARTELSVQSVLGRSLAVVKGFSAPELEPVFARARALCAQIGEPVLAFRPLYGQWVMHWWKLELDKALELADETLTLAEKVKDPAMLLTGNLARGATLFYLGKFVFANEHLEKAVTIFDLWQSLSEELEFRRIASFGYLSLGLYELGYPDRARAKSREMLAVAQRSSLPFVLANAYGHAAAHNLITGNGAAAQRQTEESLALAREMGIVSFLAMATVRRGACLIAQGRFEEGIADMRKGISASLATGGTPPALFLVLSCLRSWKDRTAPGRT